MISNCVCSGCLFPDTVLIERDTREPIGEKRREGYGNRGELTVRWDGV